MCSKYLGSNDEDQDSQEDITSVDALEDVEVVVQLAGIQKVENLRRKTSRQLLNTQHLMQCDLADRPRGCDTRQHLTWHQMNTLKMTELVRFWPSVSTLSHCLSAWLCKSFSSFCRCVQAVVGVSPHSLLLLGASCVLVLGARVVLPLVTPRLYSHRNSVAVGSSGSR